MVREKLYLSTMDENAHVLAKQYGLGLELTEFSVPWNLDRELEQTIIKLQKKVPCTDRFLIHGPYSELFPCAVDPIIRQVADYRFRQTLRMAQNYSAAKVIFHGGYNERLFFPVWYQEQSVEFWKKFADQIPEGITVCLENVLETTPEMLGNIVRQVDSPKIRMCLDVGHAHAYSEASPEEWVESCGDVIAHFHIHNNDGTRDTHSQLCEGNIPMDSLLEKIDAHCPDATITLEIDGAEPSVKWLAEKKLLEG